MYGRVTIGEVPKCDIPTSKVHGWVDLIIIMIYATACNILLFTEPFIFDSILSHLILFLPAFSRVPGLQGGRTFPTVSSRCMDYYGLWIYSLGCGMVLGMDW